MFPIEVADLLIGGIRFRWLCAHAICRERPGSVQAGLVGSEFVVDRHLPVKGKQT
jgi:hypothetical protein